MGKISVEVSDEVEKKIRKYIADHYWQNPFGKLSEIVEEALKMWIEKNVGEARE
jgi:Arc/MetJ-type ribon-helix-helix transcriptional regulator